MLPETNQGAPDASAERFEQIRRQLGPRIHAHRGHRDEPVELARRRDCSRDRTPSTEEARGERGGVAPAAAALAGRGGRGRPHDRARGRRLRGRPRWFLAGALVADAWHRSPRDSPDERRRVARASAGEDGPARHRAAQAGLPRLAARRAGPLQHGRDPDARGRGRQAPEPGAGEPDRRAHPHHQPDEGLPGAPRHPELQADLAHGAGASGDAAYAGGRDPAAEHARRAAARHGAAALRDRPDHRDRAGAPRTTATGTRQNGRTRWSGCWHA